MYSYKLYFLNSLCTHADWLFALTVYSYRLDESKSRNVKLQAELQTVRRQHEALIQRKEEEVLLATAAVTSDRERFESLEVCVVRVHA